MRINIPLSGIFFLVLLSSACSKDSTAPSIVARVNVSPGTAAMLVGETRQLVVTAEDATGGSVTAPVTWRSSAHEVATVSRTGLVTATGRGSATITATAGGVQGQFLVTVSLPVFSVQISPASPTPLLMGDTLRLTAVGKDSLGNVVEGAVSWQTNNPARAVVDATGLVTAKEFGEVVVTATVGGRSGSATVRVQLTLKQISSARATVCGVAANGRAYCWGSNELGQLGNGSPDTAHRNVPVRVAGDVAYTQVAVGGLHACGLSTAGAAYCWGYNVLGQLGNGTNDFNAVRNPTPTAVAGGRVFTSLSAGFYHTCGLTVAGEIFCWGDNEVALLGSPVAETCTANNQGSTVTFPCSKTPRIVAGGVTYSALSVGSLHTCAVATSGAAYCWGLNHLGALGIGVADTVTRYQANLVTGSRTYTAIVSGFNHSCGIATGGAAFCWGENYDGTLGTGTNDTLPHPTPLAVAGGHNYTMLTSSGWHTCGVTTSGSNLCWGYNEDGQLGSVATAICVYDLNGYSCSPTPTAVSGSVKFTAMSAAWFSTCGVTSKSGIYCWGDNGLGQLGTGNDLSAVSPVPVTGSPLGSTPAMAGFPRDLERRRGMGIPRTVSGLVGSSRNR